MIRTSLFSIALTLLALAGCKTSREITPLDAPGAGSTALLDAQRGLPHARLGSPYPNMGEMETTEELGRWLTTTRPADTLKWRGFPVESVEYNFLHGDLYSIKIEVMEKGPTGGILEALQMDYGTDYSLEVKTFDSADTKLEIREWAGQTTYLVFKNADNLAGGTLILVDRAMWDKMEKPRKEKKEKLSEMLNMDPWPYIRKSPVAPMETVEVVEEDVILME